jgi:hypothetical protein
MDQETDDIIFTYIELTRTAVVASGGGKTPG